MSTAVVINRSIPVMLARTSGITKCGRLVMEGTITTKNRITILIPQLQQSLSISCKITPSSNSGESASQRHSKPTSKVKIKTLERNQNSRGYTQRKSLSIGILSVLTSKTFDCGVKQPNELIIAVVMTNTVSI